MRTLGGGRFVGSWKRIMKLPRRLLVAQIWAPLSLRSAIASSSEASASGVWDRWSRFGAESSSRWLAASSVCGNGSSGDANRPTLLAAWGAALMAGVVAMELGRSDGVACCEGLERPLASPMGKTPESKLAQPKFFLSG